MQCLGHVSRKGGIHKIFWLENMKRIDHLEDLGVDGKKILE